MKKIRAGQGGLEMPRRLSLYNDKRIPYTPTRYMITDLEHIFNFQSIALYSLTVHCFRLRQSLQRPKI